MIRRATVEDLERLAEIHVFGWRNAYRGIVRDEILFVQMTVTRRAEWLRKHHGQGGIQTFVFDDGGVVKGFASIGNPANSDDGEDAMVLEGLYVDPPFMRQGVGTRLLEFFHDEARRSGKTRAVVWTFKDNAIGRAFYLKNGYAEDGVEKMFDAYGAKVGRLSKRL